MSTALLGVHIAFARLELLELEHGRRPLTSCPGIEAVATLCRAAKGEDWPTSPNGPSVKRHTCPDETATVVNGRWICNCPGGPYPAPPTNSPLPAQAVGGEKPASISIHARYGRLFNDGAYTQPGWWVPHEDYERLRRHWEDACKQIGRTA